MTRRGLFARLAAFVAAPRAIPSLLGSATPPAMAGTLHVARETVCGVTPPPIQTLRLRVMEPDLERFAAEMRAALALGGDGADQRAASSSGSPSIRFARLNTADSVAVPAGSPIVAQIASHCICICTSSSVVSTPFTRSAPISVASADARAMVPIGNVIDPSMGGVAIPMVARGGSVPQRPACPAEALP